MAEKAKASKFEREMLDYKAKWEAMMIEKTQWEVC
jgi:hypothetical protein